MESHAKMEEKRSALFTKLESREAERAAAAAAAAATSAANANPEEDVDAVESEIKTHATLASSSLDQAEAILESSTSSPEAKAGVDAAAEAIQTLVTVVTRAATFAPPSVVAGGHKALKSLQARLEHLRATADGSVRFSFSARTPHSSHTPATRHKIRQRTGAKVRRKVKVRVGSSSPSPSPSAAASSSNVPRQKPLSYKDVNSDLVVGEVGEVLASEVIVENACDCEIVIAAQVRAVYLKHLTRVIVRTPGGVSSSVHISHASDSGFELLTSQLRIHDSTSTTFDVWTRSGPIIERCQDLVFGPYPRGSAQDLGYGQTPHAWSQVQDFDWHKQEASPNWHVSDKASDKASEASDKAERSEALS